MSGIDSRESTWWSHCSRYNSIWTPWPYPFQVLKEKEELYTAGHRVSYAYWCKASASRHDSLPASNKKILRQLGRRQITVFWHLSGASIWQVGILSVFHWDILVPLLVDNKVPSKLYCSCMFLTCFMYLGRTDGFVDHDHNDRVAMCIIAERVLSTMWHPPDRAKLSRISATTN